MASTILEQVRDNVRRGAVIPRVGGARSADRTERPVDCDRMRKAVEASFGNFLDAQLEAFLERALSLPALGKLPLGDPKVRQHVTDLLEAALRQIVTGDAAGPLAPASVPQEHRAAEAMPAMETTVLQERQATSTAIAEMRQLLEPLRDLPHLVEERLAAADNSGLLHQLRELVQELRAGTPVAKERAGSSSNTETKAPRDARVPLDDIQRMIEVLR